MRGAVAAGHPLTAQAGAEILAEGGNAVDACIAAACVSWVAESPLTGPAAGGFMLVHRARDNTDRLLDFFVAVPGLGLGSDEAVAEMETVKVTFDHDTTQVFRIGAASCAVPGAVAGLEHAHRAYGTIPWARLLEPAIRAAREGVEVIPPQAYLHAILDLILRHDEDGREIYGPRGAALLAGERLVMTDLAETLEVLARAGASAFYEGELGQALVGHVRGHGGTITLDDLRSYRVIRRRPIRVPSGGHVFVTNPPPSSGGALIGYGLLLLDQAGPGGPPGSADAMARLVEVMREQNRARQEAFAAELFRGGLTRRLYASNVVAEAASRLGNTTHISVVDERGNAASMTASTGSGAGVVVPATGIHLNNMLGEYDLSPEGARTQAGRRLTSMMAPSLVLRDGRPRLVVGSAGSVRLRGAILQIVVNVILHGQPIDEAIARPRVHLEEPHVHCEGGADPAELDRLAAMGYELVRWRRHNLYFGGASGVEFRDDGTLAAAGDPRRGGHGVVVE